MLPCVLGIIIGLAGVAFEIHAGNGHAAGWAGLSGLWAFVASWTWKRPERRARFVAPGEMGGEAGFYRPLGSQRTPPFMARLRYHPTAVRNEPGLWLLPAALLIVGSWLLAWVFLGGFHAFR